MSEKVLDAHGRWRNITVAFRVSPEEDEQIERLVKLTGLRAGRVPDGLLVLESIDQPGLGAEVSPADW